LHRGGEFPRRWWNAAADLASGLHNYCREERRMSGVGAAGEAVATEQAATGEAVEPPSKEAGEGVIERE
jgi:hypothetical protein